MEVDFIKNGNGVHVLGLYGTYTLCGDTTDGDTIPEGACVPTDDTTVTCEKCLEIIAICRAAEAAGGA